MSTIDITRALVSMRTMIGYSWDRTGLPNVASSRTHPEMCTTRLSGHRAQARHHTTRSLKIICPTKVQDAPHPEIRYEGSWADATYVDRQRCGPHALLYDQPGPERLLTHTWMDEQASKTLQDDDGPVYRGRHEERRHRERLYRGERSSDPSPA